MNFKLEFNKSSPLIGKQPIDFKEILDIRQGESCAVWASLLDTHPMLLHDLVAYAAKQGITLQVAKHKTAAGHDVYEVGCIARKTYQIGKKGPGTIDALELRHHEVFTRRVYALLSVPEKHIKTIGGGYWQKAASVGIIRYSTIHQQLSSYAMFRRYRHGSTEAIRREVAHMCNISQGEIVFETTPQMEAEHFGLPYEDAKDTSRAKRYYINLDKLSNTFPSAFDATKRPD